MQVMNGGSGPSGISQKTPASVGHGVHPVHLDHAGTQNPRSRVIPGDSPIRMMNGPLLPYHNGGGGGFGLVGPPSRPIGSQGSPGRGHGPHEIMGPMPEGVGPSGLKNGEMGYMGSNRLMMHQQPQIPVSNNGISVKVSLFVTRH